MYKAEVIPVYSVSAYEVKHHSFIASAVREAE